MAPGVPKGQPPAVAPRKPATEAAAEATAATTATTAKPELSPRPAAAPAVAPKPAPAAAPAVPPKPAPAAAPAVPPKPKAATKPPAAAPEASEAVRDMVSALYSSIEPVHDTALTHDGVYTGLHGVVLTSPTGEKYPIVVGQAPKKGSDYGIKGATNARTAQLEAAAQVAQISAANFIVVRIGEDPKDDPNPHRDCVPQHEYTKPIVFLHSGDDQSPNLYQCTSNKNEYVINQAKDHTAQLANDPQRFIDMIAFVEAKVSEDKQNAPLIHCNGGLGRSVAFGIGMAIHHMLQKVKKDQWKEIKTNALSQNMSVQAYLWNHYLTQINEQRSPAAISYMTNGPGKKLHDQMIAENGPIHLMIQQMLERKRPAAAAEAPPPAKPEPPPRSTKPEFIRTAPAAAAARPAAAALASVPRFKEPAERTAEATLDILATVKHQELTEEGVVRISGAKTVVDLLVTPDAKSKKQQQPTIHDKMSAVKQLVRTYMSNENITFAQAPALPARASLTDYEQALRGAYEAQKIPQAMIELIIQEIMPLLAEIASEAKTTQMNASNLAAVIPPTLFPLKTVQTDIQAFFTDYIQKLLEEQDESYKTFRTIQSALQAKNFESITKPQATTSLVPWSRTLMRSPCSRASERIQIARMICDFLDQQQKATASAKEKSTSVDRNYESAMPFIIHALTDDIRWISSGKKADPRKWAQDIIANPREALQQKAY